MDNGSYSNVLVFDGFGGMGRRSRRNDYLLLDPLSGKLKAIEIEGAPSQQLHQTASVVGDFDFVIGVRSDPSNVLNDVWVLNTAKMKWKLVQCASNVFPPRRSLSTFTNSSKFSLQVL